MKKRGTNFTIKYLLILILLLLCAAALFGLSGFLCKSYTDSIDSKYNEMSKIRDYAVPSVVGNGMGLDYIYNIKSSGSGRKLIVYGASTSIIGMENAGDFELVKACSGSATIYSYMIMKNYLDDIGLVQNSDDIVKIDVSAVLFKKTGLSQDVLASALSYGGIYTVNDDYSLSRSPLHNITKYFALNARSMQKAFEYAKEKLCGGSYDGLFSFGINDYSSYDKFISIDEDRIADLESFILSFDGQIVIDILYESEEFRQSKAGSLFDSFADDTLIPFLEKNSIAYIDSRTVLEESSYMDNTHLNYEGRLAYTEWVNSSITELFR